MDTYKQRMVLLAVIITCAGGIPLSRNWPSSVTLKWPQASLFPPYPWHGVNWSSEEKSIIWMDGLSGDGPIERYTNHLQQKNTVSSSQIYLQTPTSTQNIDNLFPDFSIDSITTDSEDIVSDEEVVRSSFSFGGPSSLLNTFIFRPTTPTILIEYTPTPTLSITDISENFVNSYQWSSYERQSRQPESREIAQSEKSTPIFITYIATAISATHIYEWSEPETSVPKITVQTTSNFGNLSNQQTIPNKPFISDVSSIFISTPVIPTRGIDISNDIREESSTEFDFILLSSSFSSLYYTKASKTHQNGDLSSTDLKEVLMKTHLLSEIRDIVLSSMENSYRTKEIESYISAPDSLISTPETYVSAFESYVSASESYALATQSYVLASKSSGHTTTNLFHSIIERVTSQNEILSSEVILSTKASETSLSTNENIWENVSDISASVHPKPSSDCSANSETLSTMQTNLRSQTSFKISLQSPDDESNRISETSMDLSISNDNPYSYVKTSSVSVAVFSTMNSIDSISSLQRSPTISLNNHHLLSSFIVSEDIISSMEKSENYEAYSPPLDRNYSTFFDLTTVDYYFTTDIDSIFISTTENTESNALSLENKSSTTTTIISRSAREILESSISSEFILYTYSLNETSKEKISMLMTYSNFSYIPPSTVSGLLNSDSGSVYQSISKINDSMTTEQSVGFQSYATLIEPSVSSPFLPDNDSKHHITVRSEPYSDENTNLLTQTIENIDNFTLRSESTNTFALQSLNTNLFTPINESIDLFTSRNDSTNIFSLSTDQIYNSSISSDNFIHTSLLSSISPTTEIKPSTHLTEMFSSNFRTLQFSNDPSIISSHYTISLREVSSQEWSLIRTNGEDLTILSSSQFGHLQTSLTDDLHDTKLISLSSLFHESFETMTQYLPKESSIIKLDSNIFSTISGTVLNTRKPVIYTTNAALEPSYATLNPSVKTNDVSKSKFSITKSLSNSLNYHTQSLQSKMSFHSSLNSASFYDNLATNSDRSLIHPFSTVHFTPEFTQQTLALLSQLSEFSRLNSSTQSNISIQIDNSTPTRVANTIKSEEHVFATSSENFSHYTKLISLERENSLFLRSLRLDELSSLEKLHSSTTIDMPITIIKSSISSVQSSKYLSSDKLPGSSLSDLNLYSPTAHESQYPFYSSPKLSPSIDTPHFTLKSQEMEWTFQTVESHTVSHPLSCNLPPVLQITSSHLSDYSYLITGSDNFTPTSLHPSSVVEAYNWSNSFLLSNLRSDFPSLHSLASHSPYKSDGLLRSSFTSSRFVVLPTPFTSSLPTLISVTPVVKPLSQLETDTVIPHPITTPSPTTLSSIYYPTEYEEIPSSPGSRDKALMDKNYWILTVLEAPLKHELPENFSHTMELRLANAYSEAFRSYRSKRDDTVLSRLEFIIVKILSLTHNMLLNQLEMVYIVERGGDLVPAAAASATLDILRHDKLRGFLGHSIIVKATPYEPEKRATIVEHTSTAPTAVIVGSIIGALLALLLIICIYFRCCRSKTVVASTASSESGSLQRSLSTYGQHNRKQIFQEVTHYIGTEGEGHPGKGQIGPPVKPISSNIPISGRNLPKLPQIPTEQSDLPPSRAKKKAQRIDVGTLTAPIETNKSKTDFNGEKKREKSAKSSVDGNSKEQTGLHQNGVSSETLKLVGRPPSEETRKSEDSLISTSASNGSSSPTSSKTDTESASDGSNAALLPLSRAQMAAKAKLEGEAQVAATQLHLTRVRQRISELLDDAFAMAGAQRPGTSLRNKRVNPCSDSFPRFNSLRSPQKRASSEMAQRYALNESEGRLLDGRYRPSSTGGGGQQLLGALTDDGKLEILPVPKVVWRGSSGDETEDTKSLNSESVDARLSSGSTCRAMSRARSATFRPSSSLPVLDALDELSTDLFAASRTLQGAASDHQLPYSSRMNPAALDQYDEIDVINALKEGEPIAAIIQAIKDELQKFNNTLPGTNDNESSA